ncbi:MAG TPA: MFS transporter [Steroidobacteraceae bacterium]|nr:MFS transporter [Steroidobacteraceae bacterium]
MSDRPGPPPASSPFERWRSATLAPFEHRVFALFWWASLASSFGSMIQTVGASWLMTTIAPAPDKVALVQTANSLPFFFLSLVAGAYADTRDRRSIMLLSQVVALLSSVGLAVVVLTGSVTPSLLLGFTFLIGCGAAAFAPAWQASIGDQVPRTLIAPAIMANAVGFNLARSVGPALGGLLVAAVGVAVAFIVNAVSYLGILATLLWWRPRRSGSELPPEPLGQAVGAGLRYVGLSPHLLSILSRCALYTFPIVAVPALMPVVARDLLGGGAATYGVMMGGFGAGAMLGALSSATLRQRYTSDALLRMMSALACVAVVGIGQSRWMGLTLLANVLAGGAWTLSFANFNIAVQLSSPRWVTGRMLAIYQTVVFASMAVGAWWWGEYASVVGLRSALTVAGVASLLSLLAARWLPIAPEQLGSFDPRMRAALTPPSVDVHPTSGPIVVVIEYRVPPEKAVEFVGVINEVSRIRRRDGARAWSISQDVDDVDLWVERFECPTWLDYLRWRTRPTQSDQAVRERLVRLIAGEHGKVRRLVVRPPGSHPLGAPLPAEHEAPGKERGEHERW